MSGVQFVGRWHGAFGAYDIPPAIMALAEKAQRRAGLDVWREPPMRPFWSDPLFRVVEEWGVWRDAEEARSWGEQ